MSTEEDIGALKADMATVKDTSKETGDKVDELVTTMSAHTATMMARMDRADERHDDLSDGHDKLKGRHYKLERDTPSQKKIVAALAVVASVAGVIGSFIGDLFKSGSGP